MLPSAFPLQACSHVGGGAAGLGTSPHTTQTDRPKAPTEQPPPTPLQTHCPGAPTHWWHLTGVQLPPSYV